MKLYSYPELELHSEQHRLLTEKVFAFKDSFEAGEKAMDRDFMTFLHDWIVNHILTSDRKFGVFLNKK
jgi:hemerythrin-like metal-binding protein